MVSMRRVLALAAEYPRHRSVQSPFRGHLINCTRGDAHCLIEICLRCDEWRRKLERSTNWAGDYPMFIHAANDRLHRVVLERRSGFLVGGEVDRQPHALATHLSHDGVGVKVLVQ